MNKNKGFTLIELIVYVSTLAIISIVLTLFVFNFINIYTKIRITKDVSEGSQRVMEIMLLEIRHAKNAYEPTSSFDTHPGQLSLETEKDTPIDEETTYINFYLDEDKRLLIKKEGEEAEILTPENIEINNLIFNYLTINDTESIRIELLANYRNQSKRTIYQATTTIISSASLRND